MTSISLYSLGNQQADDRLNIPKPPRQITRNQITRKMALLLCAIGTLTVSTTATAQQDSLQMTIYGNHQALVEDVRTINFPKGRSSQTLSGVSSHINAASVGFEASGVDIVEQNFDYDLLTPNKLMQKAVGQSVYIVRTNPGTGVETRERAKILAVNDGVVVQIGRHIEVLRDDQIPTRVIFDKIPENLRAEPTLSIQVDSVVAGSRRAALSYLTGGLSWAADYVLNFDEANGVMDFQGWATIKNQTSTNFKQVQTSLIAGQVGEQNNRYNQYNYNRGKVRSGGTESSPQERIGDNYLYPLKGKTDIAAKQTKQISFIDVDNAKASKAYEYEANGFTNIDQPQSADVRIVFSNSAAAGLGQALPKGTIRVYGKDQNGRSQFIGQDQIGHVAAGSDLAIKIGEAFDITVKPTVIKRDQVSKRVTETSMKYEIKNAKSEAIELTIRQALWGWRSNYKILTESHKSQSPNAFSKTWTIRVPANGKETLNFTIREKQ